MLANRSFLLVQSSKPRSFLNCRKLNISRYILWSSIVLRHMYVRKIVRALDKILNFTSGGLSHCDLTRAFFFWRGGFLWLFLLWMHLPRVLIILWSDFMLRTENLKFCVILSILSIFKPNYAFSDNYSNFSKAATDFNLDLFTIRFHMYVAWNLSCFAQVILEGFGYI